MSRFFSLTTLSILVLLAFGQVRIPGPGGEAIAAGGIPTLAQIIGKGGIDRNRGGSTTAANAQIWNFDSTGARVLTSGSMIAMTGTWINNPTTGGGYHATCTAPCAPAFVDSGSTALTAVFTNGTGCLDSNGNDHNVYYEQNIGSGITFTKDAFPQLTSDNNFDANVFYNVATTGGTDGTHCDINKTPANNTAPNISGTAFTVTNGDLVIVGIDDQSNLQANTVSSITVPSGCSLMTAHNTPSGSYGIAHWSMYCIASSTSFTPQFTVAQTTHDTFTIYAAAFKSGSGGSAPAAGIGVLAQYQYLIAGNSTNVTVNVGCSSSTSGIVVTDDAGSLTSVTDSNSNTFTGIAASGSLGSGIREIFRSLSVTTTGMPNTYTMTLHAGSSGNVDIINIYCTNATTLDTLTAGSGSTQVNTNTVDAVSGTCTSDHCTSVPLVTPTHAGDLFFETCEVGLGPLLQAYNLSGNITDFVVPAASANIVGGDADDYNNGDMSGHYYTNATTQINFGWNSISTSAAPACMVQAVY